MQLGPGTRIWTTGQMFKGKTLLVAWLRVQSEASSQMMQIHSRVLDTGRFGIIHSYVYYFPLPSYSSFILFLSLSPCSFLRHVDIDGKCEQESLAELQKC